MVKDRRPNFADKCVDAIWDMNGLDNSRGTYDNHSSNKHGIHEEVSRLREATGLPLNSAAILVQKVWIKQDSKLWLRYEKGREDAPDLRSRLRCEDGGRHEDVLVEADDAAIAQS